MIMKHTCRKGGQRVGTLDGPVWVSPGEIVRLVDEERWGRVKSRWMCCDSYDVMCAPDGKDDAAVYEAMALGSLEDPWTDYPNGLPPVGYRIPVNWPGTGDRPFGRNR